MTKRDYYEVLNVSKTASADEIKKSYRSLAMKFHPDRNGGDADAEGKFKEASEAYEVLSDDSKRKTYDRNGHAGVKAEPAAAWNDIFSAMANGFTANFQTKGADVEVIYYINLKDLFSESSHTIQYKRPDKCTTCNGSGLKADKVKQRCIICGGSGKTSKQSMSHGVRHVMFGMCDCCNGQGQTIKKEDRCEACEGKGEAETNASLTFKLPMGMPLGRALAFQAHGGIGRNNGPRGDLYIKIVANHQKLVPSHDNPAELNYDLKIPYWKAVLGGEEKIEAPDGKELNLIVPPLCQSGTSKRVEKEGLPIFGRSDRGDLIITYNVAVPDVLSDQMKTLVESMKELENAI